MGLFNGPLYRWPMARGRTLPKTLTGDELERLLAAPNLDAPTGLRDRCVLELMCRCGLRVSEVCGLHLRDVDWREGEIRLRAEITKGGKEATAYLDDGTLALLERWKSVRRAYGAGRPHLFVCVRSDHRGEPLDRRRVWEMVRRRAERAGIDRKVWCHMLRHTFATDTLAKPEYTIRDVQKLMRHSDLRTTAIYLEVRDEDLKAKVQGRRRRP
ncbi:MAG: tyrosine-type recombinase/integrase [Acidiferrobacteraceae bacterium]